MSLFVSTRVGVGQLTSVQSIHTWRGGGMFGSLALVQAPPMKKWVNEQSWMEWMKVKALHQ